MKRLSIGASAFVLSLSLAGPALAEQAPAKLSDSQLDGVVGGLVTVSNALNGTSLLNGTNALNGTSVSAANGNTVSVPVNTSVSASVPVTAPVSVGLGVGLPGL